MLRIKEKVGNKYNAMNIKKLSRVADSQNDFGDKNVVLEELSKFPVLRTPAGSVRLNFNLYDGEFGEVEVYVTSESQQEFYSKILESAKKRGWDESEYYDEWVEKFADICKKFASFHPGFEVFDPFWEEQIFVYKSEDIEDSKKRKVKDSCSEKKSVSKSAWNKWYKALTSEDALEDDELNALADKLGVPLHVEGRDVFLNGTDKEMRIFDPDEPKSSDLLKFACLKISDSKNVPSDKKEELFAALFALERAADAAFDAIEWDDLEVSEVGKSSVDVELFGKKWHVEFVAGEDSTFPDDVTAYVTGGSPDGVWTSDSTYTLACRVIEHCFNVDYDWESSEYDEYCAKHK